MPSSSAIEAGRAFLRLVVEDSEFKKGLQQSAQRMDSFGRSLQKTSLKLAAAGATITAPFIAATKIFTQMGAELDDISKRTGATVERLSELKFAAEQSGTDLSAVEAAYKKMSRTLAAANKGVAGSVDALTDLGLTIEQLNGLSPDAQFEKLARAVDAISDPTRRAALAMKVFGGSGTALLPLISEMDELFKKAKRFNLVVTKDGVDAAAKLDDAFGLLAAVMKQVAFEIGNALAPEVTSLTEKLADSTAGIVAWVNENRDVVRIAAETGAALVILAGVVSAVGTAFRGAASAIVAFKSAASLLGKLPGPVKIAAGIAIVGGLIAELIGRLNDSGPQKELSVNEQIAATQQRIAELKKEIAGFVPVANEMDMAYQNLTRHNLQLAESALKALSAQKRLGRELPANFPTRPALSGRAQLPALLPPLPDDWRENLYASWKKQAASPAFARLASASAEIADLDPGRFQFGGRGAEQNFGGTKQDRVAEESRDLLKKIERKIDGPLRIGHS